MKKIIKTSVFAASVLALASAAHAEININITGASAQNKFWSEAAGDFLTTVAANGGLECDPATVASAKYDKKNGISKGENCQAVGGQTVYIRYTASASFDGPRSVFGIDPDNLDSCDTIGYDDNYREMVDETTVDWAAGTATGLACKDITLGASDVASESFEQESHGYVDGHLGGEWRDIVLDPTDNPSEADGLVAYRPIVVPFSFFANDVALPNLDSLSRLQAVLLFNGNVSNWSQFGRDYPDKKTVICLRHAGSGTHATLDKAVMRGDYKLATTQATPPSFLNLPTIYFYESSSDLMACVQDNGGLSTDTHAAVGYADTDKHIDGFDASGNEIIDPSWPNAKRLLYNGVGAGVNPGNFATCSSDIKDQIRNGVYSFWSAQWIYENPNAPEYATTHDVVTKMMDFASVPRTCDPNWIPGYYWATGSEMGVTKDNDSVLPKF